MRVRGKIEHKDLGMGTWVLVSENGETYELYNAPTELYESNLKVEIVGKIRDDVMSMAMVGKILEVESFKTI